MSAHASPSSAKKTVRDFLEMKTRGEPIAVLTCADYLFARLLEGSGIDMILVGDSLGQAALGYDSTLPVTLDEMLHHTGAVRRGARDTFLVMDLPFMSYQVSDADALRSAGRAMKEAGAQAVKLEGGDEEACSRVRALVRAGVPVMGHIGFVPQSVHALGGYRVQGREERDGRRLRKEAKALEEAGCFSVVLELVPGEVAADITGSLRIPTIGIGAGVECDGQVLVLSDALGLDPAFSPRFLKRFANLAEATEGAIRSFQEEVKARTYPGPEHTFEADG